MNNLNIIEYNDTYAKAVSEMWNKSAEGWNGFWADTTEESVRNDLKNTSSLNIYLAEKEKEILGYCEFSKYQEDEGALYIKLLNVRFDQHGKGIGKILVKKAIDRTIELEWPRLDLYTWAGNTKSIPLYKRCGFFYEDILEYNHFMNFIPYVLKTEALNELFEYFNWYEDLKRAIDLLPDGRKENGFDFYEYRWEKDGKFLRTEFERKGRGLRLIETDDYLVSAIIPNHECVFGRDYQITYEIINKSGNPLNIKINGSDNKNIRFNCKKEFDVKDRLIINDSFFVDTVETETEDNKTHPVVSSDIYINGKKAEFKLGVNTKFPAAVKLSGNNTLEFDSYPRCYINNPSELYLEILNNFDEEAVFSFTLKNNDKISFETKTFKIKLDPKEKKSIPVSYILKDFNIYNEKTDITVELKTGESFTYTTFLSSVFKGDRGIFAGYDAANNFILVNGTYSLRLGNEMNRLYVSEFEYEREPFFFSYPKPGKPFISDFSNTVPEIEWYREDEKAFLKLSFKTDLYKGYIFSSITSLTSSGLIEQFYEVKNISDKDGQKEICMLHSIYMSLKNFVFPADNKIVKISKTNYEDMDCIDSEIIDENWLYSHGKDFSLGLTWTKNMKLDKDNWFFNFEHNLGKINIGECRNSDSIRVSYNKYLNWEDFRKSALENNLPEQKVFVEDLEVAVNKNNPFVKDELTIDIKEYKSKVLDGSFIIESTGSTNEKIVKTVTEEEDIRETNINTPFLKETSEIITVTSDLKITETKKKALVYKIGKNKVETEYCEDKKILTADNGMIKIKSAPDFAPGIFSMEHKGHEWLDSSYPTPREKSWWNPWFGGNVVILETLNFRAIKNQPSDASFITLKDNFGNNWNGIKTILKLNHEDKFKGLEFTTYFLMLPNVPVLCVFSELIQTEESFIQPENVESSLFLKPSEDIKKCFVIAKNRNNEKIKYKLGIEGINIAPSTSILYGASDIKEKIQIFMNNDKVKAEGFININASACFLNEKLSFVYNKKTSTTPLFYVFTEEYIEDDLLKDLKNIKFN